MSARTHRRVSISRSGRRVVLSLIVAAFIVPATASPAPPSSPATLAAPALPIAAASGAPGNAAELWQKGNEAFRGGKFAAAVGHYERALAAGGGSALGHYNLGTAYYRLGSAGLAILHLEKALQLAPRMDEAKKNLVIVHRHVDLDKLSQEIGLGLEGFWRRFVRSFTTDETAIVFLVLYYLFFGALISRRFVRPGTVRSLLTIGSVALLVLALTGGSFFAYRLYRQERIVEGIVLEPKTSLMEPHGGAWKAVRQLPQGLRVRVQSQNDRWVKIRLANGLSGYVRKAQLGTL